MSPPHTGYIATERDLNIDFFESARQTKLPPTRQRRDVPGSNLIDGSSSGANSPHRVESTNKEGSASKLSRRNRNKEWLLSPVVKTRRAGQAIKTNLLFFRSVVFPQIGRVVSNKWHDFSLSRTLARTFPGLVLLWTGCMACACRGCEGTESEQKDKMSDEAVLCPPTSDATVKIELSPVVMSTAPTVSETPESPDGMDKSTAQTAEAKKAANSATDKYPTPELIRSSILVDLFAGFAVGAMSIPQGMSYALLAGLQYQYGLYNNVIHPLVYFIFGSCRHAVIGVSAVENIMAGESITSILGPDATADQRHNCALLLCLCLVFVFLIFRFLKLAIVADLLADPVLSGFATAAAFVIGTSQLKYVFGLSSIKSDWGIPQTWVYILSHIPEIDYRPLICTIISLILLYCCKKLSRFTPQFPIPGPLILVILGCLISWSCGLEDSLQLVGYIPQGLPGVSWPSFSFSTSPTDPLNAPSFWTALLQSCKLAALYFIIHMSISKTIAIRNNYQIDVPQELVALAACEGAATVFSGFPGATSLSRSSVVESLGVKTGFHNLAQAVIVILTLLLLTTPLGYLPMACLAAVVLFGVSRMAEFHTLTKLWSLQKASWAAVDSIGGGVSSPDLLLWLAAFLFTMVLGAETGIIIAVVVSLLCLGKDIVRPQFIQLGRLPDTQIYRNIRRFPDALVDSAIVLYRIDTSLSFANANFLEKSMKFAIRKHFEPVHNSESETLRLRCGRNSSSGAGDTDEQHHSPEPIALTPPYFLILDCSSVNGLDVTAISALRRVVDYALKRQTQIVFANWKGPQRDYLQRADFYAIVPPHLCFLSTHDAVLWSTAARTRALNPNYSCADEPDWIRADLSTQNSENEEPPLKQIRQSGSTPSVARAAPLGSSFCLMEQRIQTDRLLAAAGQDATMEWDGLSALVPNVRTVREVGYDGQNREWQVATMEQPRGNEDTP